MKSKTISRLPGVASEGTAPAFVLILLVPNPYPNTDARISKDHRMPAAQRSHAGVTLVPIRLTNTPLWLYFKSSVVGEVGEV